MSARLAFILLAAAVGLSACSIPRFGRDDDVRIGELATPASELGDPEAINAEARRILQTRSFTQLRESVTEAEVQAISAVLEAQVAAWNRGDLAAFMDTYWRSPDLRFASGDTPVRGWADALRRYRADYPDRTDMGELRISDVEITILAPDAATAFGRWRLAQATESPGGLFTLVLRKIDGRWLIIHDHTSTGGV
jgi:ketosteroid isomerase-like protein